MQYNQLKGKSVIILGAVIISLAACNSGSSSSTIADTSVATAQDRPVDTMQQQMQDETPAQTTTAQQQPQTTAPEENVPAPSSSSTAAPSTSSSASSSQSAATTPSTTNTKKVIVKKKVQAIVEVVPVPAHSKTRMDKTGVYEYAEVGPQYPSGQAGIERYINNHIQYPPQALNNNVEGRVDVSFVVNENGRVTDAHVVGKGLHDGLNAEAVRVVSSMPNWRPGMIKGRPVRTRMTMPITFRIVG